MKEKNYCQHLSTEILTTTNETSESGGIVGNEGWVKTINIAKGLIGQREEEIQNMKVY